MIEVFSPSKLMQFAKGGEAFTQALPEGLLELFEIVRYDREQAVECGSGLKALGIVAAKFLHSGPKSLEDAIAYDWSSTHNLLVPHQVGEISLQGENERPKRINEYTRSETEAWTRFMDGLDPSDASITRDTAVSGLFALGLDMNAKVGNVSKYSLSAGENSLVFDRVKKILRGTPYIIAKTILPDMTADEASRIFSLKPEQYPEIVDTFIENAKGPIFAAPDK